MSTGEVDAPDPPFAPTVKVEDGLATNQTNSVRLINTHRLCAITASMNWIENDALLSTAMYMTTNHVSECELSRDDIPAPEYECSRLGSSDGDTPFLFFEATRTNPKVVLLGSNGSKRTMSGGCAAAEHQRGRAAHLSAALRRAAQQRHAG